MTVSLHRCRARLPMLRLRHRPCAGRAWEAAGQATPALRPCTATLDARQSCSPLSVVHVATTAEEQRLQNHHHRCQGGSASSSTYHAQLNECMPTASRRSMGLAAASLAAGLLLPTQQAQASKLAAFDQAWESIGGGPADLYFPKNFAGVWDVTSVLVSVEKPLGDEYIPNKAPVERAIREDLQKASSFRVKYIPTPDGARMIFDRRYNTAAMLESYYGSSVDLLQRITWDPSDPNVLRVSMPGGLSIRTRVTRRSTTVPGPDRIETSEFFEQVFDDGVSPARIKANQCYTKYKWRDAEAASQAGGPEIVATQVVSDFLTPYDGESLYMQAMNRPVVIYTYRMSFTRPASQTA